MTILTSKLAADLKILPTIQFARDTDVATLAKRVGMKPEALGRKMRSLQQRELLSAGVIVNSFALGLRNYCILFSPVVERVKDTKAIVTYLQNHPAVSWFAEFSGSYRFAVSLLGYTAHDLSRFFEDLHEKFGPVMADRLVAERAMLAVYPCRVYGEAKKFECVEIRPPEGELARFDKIDGKILGLLCTKPESSSRDLCQKLGIPQSTLSYRVRRLQETGALQKLTWVHNANDVGFSSHRLYLVSRAPSAQQREAIDQFCRSEPGVFVLTHSIGAWDYDIGVSVKRPEELRDLLERLWSRFSGTLAKVHVFEHLASHRARWFPSAALLRG